MNTRRSFIKKTATAGVLGLTGTSLIAANSNITNMEINTTFVRPKVLFFDVNETLLDLTAMKSNVLNVLGDNKDLLKLWFTTMLQYSMVTTVTGKYTPFGKIGAASLVMVAENNGIKITQQEAEDVIIPPLRNLPPHPEVKEALELLKNSGYTMVSLTNSSHEGVTTQFKSAGLTSYFDEMLTVDTIGKFKPHLEVYQWACRHMKISSHEAMLIAAHGWDIAGALAAGWRGAFIKRNGASLYPLAPLPEINQIDLLKVAKLLTV